MNKLLKNLEEESLNIIQRTLNDSKNPVVMYSIGKDSSVLLHLFRKVFFPSKVPVTFLHIDTGWKFKEMIKFRDMIASKYDLNFKVYKNPIGEKENITPFNHSKYTEILKTEALKHSLNAGKYDFVYGGARRDEEKSRAKERVLSHRDKNHVWDPKKQRIEPWYLFNTTKADGESFRVFPLSNWTELNIWQYIKHENIQIVPLYFSKKRKVVHRRNQLFLLDDDRFEINSKDEVKIEEVRFRTLGCYPLTAASHSKANSIDKIIAELKQTSYSERSTRLIDNDKEGSMELKKKEGYF